MAGFTLGDLLARPAIVTAAERDPLVFHHAGRPLPLSHPLPPAIATARSRSRSSWRCPLTDAIDFINLGQDSAPDPGLAISLHAESESRPRATWFSWGLSRPSVNLFLAPALLRHVQESALLPEEDAIVRLLESSALRECPVPATVRVRHLVEPLAYRIYPDTPMAEIQHLLIRRELPALPVVGERQEMLGVITAEQLLAQILPGREDPPRSGRDELRARDLMTRSVLCLSDDEELATASRMLISRGLPRLPVVSGDRLTGFLSGAAVLRAFSDAFVTSRSPVRLELS